MEKKQKTLHVYYKGSEQRIKLFDGTEEDKILKLIKRVFKLTVSDDKIFFQDENGDLVILPDIFPQDLSIYIYIEPEYPEPKKQIDNVEHSAILPGFKWTFAGELLEFKMMDIYLIPQINLIFLKDGIQYIVQLLIQKDNYFVNYCGILNVIKV